MAYDLENQLFKKFIFVKNSVRATAFLLLRKIAIYKLPAKSLLEVAGTSGLK